MMKQGFLSFVIGAVFLLSLVSSGVALSGRRPDYSFEEYRSALVSEVAIKSAYYSAVSEAAAAALNASIGAEAAGAETDPRMEVRAAVLAQTISFGQQLRASGYDVAFWCGQAGEASRQEASAKMAQEKAAALPDGAKPAAECRDSFDADPLSRKLHFYDVGFSLYLPDSGIGKAAVLPPSYEVGF